MHTSTSICVSLRHAILHPLIIGPCIHTTRPSMLRRKKVFFFFILFMAAQLRTCQLIQTEENRHAPGSETCFNHPFHFQEREHTTQPAHTRAKKNLSALIHFFENGHLAEPNPRICKYNPGCVHRHKNRLHHL